MAESLAERVNIYQERRKETGAVKRVGMGLLIVDLETGQIWMNREKIAKPSANRKVGDLCFPLETLKVYGDGRLEYLSDAFFGALEEFPELISDFGSGELARLRALEADEEIPPVNTSSEDTLVWLPAGKKGQTRSYKGGFVLLEGKGIAFHQAVVGFARGSNSFIHPEDRWGNDEVEFVGWMSLDEVLKQDNLRDGIRPLLVRAKEEHWIEDFMSAVEAGDPRLREVNFWLSPQNRFAWLDNDSEP